MDIVALASWRGHVKWSIIWTMLPGALVGIWLGWAAATLISDAMVRFIVAIIAISFALMQIFGDLANAPARAENGFRASFWGIFAGYTSFVAHAGAPPYQSYVLPLKLQKELVAGTSVLFFFVVNSVKLVPYFALGQFDRQNLQLSATLIPVALVGVFAGIWLVRRASQRMFYNVSYAALIAVGLKLLYDTVPVLFFGA
jgi:uncharacterized membrane protein YfcA